MIVERAVQAIIVIIDIYLSIMLPVVALFSLIVLTALIIFLIWLS